MKKILLILMSVFILVGATTSITTYAVTDKIQNDYFSAIPISVSITPPAYDLTITDWEIKMVNGTFEEVSPTIINNSATASVILYEVGIEPVGEWKVEGLTNLSEADIRAGKSIAITRGPQANNTNLSGAFNSTTPTNGIVIGYNEGDVADERTPIGIKAILPTKTYDAGDAFKVHTGPMNDWFPKNKVMTRTKVMAVTYKFKCDVENTVF